MGKVQIFYIYADNCKDCEKAKESINIAIKQSGVECEFKKFNFESKVALNIAINNDIENLPACIIGSNVFQGQDFEVDKIVKALNNTAK